MNTETVKTGELKEGDVVNRYGARLRLQDRVTFQDERGQTIIQFSGVPADDSALDGVYRATVLVIERYGFDLVRGYPRDQWQRVIA